MDTAASPVVNAILDILARTLVSKGILDMQTRVEFIQALDTIIAGIIMIVPSIITIGKLVELKKHALTTTATQKTMTITQPATAPVSQQISQNQQTGLPVGQSGK